MKQSAKTTAANPPATSPAVMFLRAVSRSTAGFLSVRAVRGSPSAPSGVPGGSPADRDPVRIRAQRRARPVTPPRVRTREEWAKGARNFRLTALASCRPGRDPPLSPRPGQAVAVARGAGVRKVWRDTRGGVTGVRRVCARSAAGPSPKGAEGLVLERSGISPVGNPPMARVSNHADPRSSYRGSKSTPQVDFEPREPPAAGSVTEMPGTPHFLPCSPTPTGARST